MKYMFENGEGEKVNPILIDKAIGFFLENQMMGDILRGKIQKGYVAAPNVRADYVAGNICIETKIFMKDSRPMEANLKSLLYSLDSNKRTLDALLKHYKRVVLLIVCEEGVDDGSMEGFSLRKVLRNIFEEELDHGIEVWISEVRIETDGIALLSCQKVVPLN
ncbi:MAG: hypothetical protein NC548_35290 [Lachnospiraceae bacterium]|nr:hypothetical protein [Lachnospiraceae bacterium]